MTTSLYSLVRLYRHRPSRYGPARDGVSVDQRGPDGQWVRLGTFTTEDEAIAVLVDRVEIMQIAERIKEEAE